MRAKTPKAHQMVLTDKSNPAAFRALKSLPTWMWGAFNLSAPLPRAEYYLAADASSFWSLSGLAGQLENVAKSAGNNVAAEELAALRGAMNAAANESLALSK